MVHCNALYFITIIRCKSKTIGKGWKKSNAGNEFGQVQNTKPLFCIKQAYSVCKSSKICSSIYLILSLNAPLWKAYTCRITPRDKRRFTLLIHSSYTIHAFAMLYLCFIIAWWSSVLYWKKYIFLNSFHSREYFFLKIFHLGHA